MLREKLLKIFLNKVPDGDNLEINKKVSTRISCNIVFYKRHDLLKKILRCLQVQTFKNFEIIIVEDKGKTEATKNLIKNFKNLNIKHVSPSKNFGKMGYMRNYGLKFSVGEIILFLDDDTIITDKFFLEKLNKIFTSDKSLMAVLPKGNASYCLVKHKYCYHDKYFFSNRCVAYRKDVLLDLKGFDNSFIGQEDVEFAIRFLARNKKYFKTDKIFFFHPPLITKKLSKPMAVGYSFAFSKKYKLLFKLLLLINGSRWIPLFIYPTYGNLQKAKFSLGFFIGFMKGLFSKKDILTYS